MVRCIGSVSGSTYSGKRCTTASQVALAMNLAIGIRNLAIATYAEGVLRAVRRGAMLRSTLAWVTLPGIPVAELPASVVLGTGPASRILWQHHLLTAYTLLFVVIFVQPECPLPMQMNIVVVMIRPMVSPLTLRLTKSDTLMKGATFLDLMAKSSRPSC